MGWSDPNAWKKYYKKNAAKIKKQARARYKKNAVAKRAYSKARYKAYPEKVKFEVRRSFLKRTYGITHEQFDVLVKANKGRCPTCKKRMGKFARWAVDHCHRSRKIRGLLCGKCNCALGFANDNIETLTRMVRYLRKSER